MAGEYKVAADILGSALQTAIDHDAMSQETMIRAMLHELLGHLASSHSREQLDEMIAYQLDSMNEEEFVVTRGC